jgi:hypothetical protein
MTQLSQDPLVLLPYILYVLEYFQMVHKKYTFSGLKKFVVVYNDQTSIRVCLCAPFRLQYLKPQCCEAPTLANIFSFTLLPPTNH